MKISISGTGRVFRPSLQEPNIVQHTMEPDKKVEEPAIAYGAEITSLDQLDLTKLYSYADYFKWKFKERVELIRGMIYKMSPSPSSTHQLVSANLFLRVGLFFERRRCKAFFAPFDVRLPDSRKQTDDELVFTVVQPDLCVICDPAKIDKRGCIGAPDLVVEILSPGSTKKDRQIKFGLYEKNGVKEYWLVEPAIKMIRVYVLREGKYIGIKPFTEDDEMASPLFPELKFNVGEVFDEGLRPENLVEDPPEHYGPEIVSLDQLSFSALYSYADYFRWKFEERVELIRGMLYEMSAPTTVHQLVSGDLFFEIKLFFKGKTCKVFAAPFDVRLPDSRKYTDDELVFTVVQPDICVVCDPAKIDYRGCIGAPDLVVEIVSKGSKKKDREIKFSLYEENDVKEYWLVEPADKTILVYVLRDGKYVGLKPFTKEDEMASPLFPELRFKVGEVFE